MDNSMTYGELVNNLRYLAKVYSICEKENMREYSLSIAAADAIENLDDICQHQADEIRELKNQWIPVTERLPEKGIDVLVFAEGKIEGFFGDTVIAISRRYDFKIFTDFEEVEVWQSPWQYFLTDYEITHWMPLPEAPKDGE